MELRPHINIFKFRVVRRAVASCAGHEEQHHYEVLHQQAGWNEVCSSMQESICLWHRYIRHQICFSTIHVFPVSRIPNQTLTDLFPYTTSREIKDSVLQSIPRIDLLYLNTGPFTCPPCGGIGHSLPSPALFFGCKSYCKPCCPHF